MDRQTDMTKLKIAIRKFANAPKNLFGQELLSKTLTVTVDSKGNIEILRSGFETQNYTPATFKR